MASGDTLCVFHPYQNEPFLDNVGVQLGARIGWRNQQPILIFPTTIDHIAVFSGVLPRWYAGGGITINAWTTSTATSGNASFGFQIERRNTDADTDSFATRADAVGVAVSGTAGIPVNVTAAMTSGAAMDSLAAGEPFRLKVIRFNLNVQDTVNSDDLQILAIEIKET